MFGLVSMLEDADYEVTYDPPDLSSTNAVDVELWVTDIQLKGAAGVTAVVRQFEERHPDLGLAIQVQ